MNPPVEHPVLSARAGLPGGVKTEQCGRIGTKERVDPGIAGRVQSQEVPEGRVPQS